MQAIYVSGKPIEVQYTPAASYSAGDIIVIGNWPFVACLPDPTFGTAIQIGNLSTFGGIYQIPADAAYACGTYVLWNTSTQKVTTTPSAGLTFPFGVIVGGPTQDLGDGGPTGSGSLCNVLHDPQAASGASGGGSNAGAITTISTVGAGTLTAAAIAGKIIKRTGPVAAFTDTTATAALIYAGLTDPVIGQTWILRIINTTAFPDTLAAGSGVTLSGFGAIIPPNSVGEYLMTLTSATAVAMTGLNVSPLTTNALEISTALTTVGAGTITGAGIAGGVTNRTGSTSGFTDTTDTASNIIAAMPNANVGQSFEYTYYNNTVAAATITGGTGVTVTLATIVPAACWARYLVTYTAASTITMVGIAMGPNAPLPGSQYSTAALSSTTASAGQLTGAQNVFMNNSGATPGTYTTRTAAQMLADIPNGQIGMSWTVFLCNGQATGTLTLAGGTGVTITGTATMAGNVGRIYQVTITGAATAVFTNVGSFTAP